MNNFILILGIGNTLMKDDAVGPMVIRRLQELAEEGDPVLLLDGGTLSFTLLEALRRHESLIVVDAARLGLAPGEWRLLRGEAMDRYLRSGRRSAHEVGLSDLLDMARLLGEVPTRRALITIEAAEIAPGEGLSPAVAAAIEPVARTIRHLVGQWTPVSNPLIEESLHGQSCHVG
ncbi:MAG: hydrogenase maturation protease [Magnetococcales bacterium]|nr:hydrogenase maturation protease [Magnetococcales bacterium]